MIEAIYVLGIAAAILVNIAALTLLALRYIPFLPRREQQASYAFAWCSFRLSISSGWALFTLSSSR
jgi:hypothetical protein